jgi:hypothetical protein
VAAPVDRPGLTGGRLTSLRKKPDAERSGKPKNSDDQQ